MFISMNCSVASPDGALLMGQTYSLPRSLAQRILAKKIAGSDAPAAEIENDAKRIARARKGLEVAVQAAEGGEEDFGGDE